MTARFRKVLRFFCGGAGTIVSTSDRGLFIGREEPSALLGRDFASKRLARVCPSSSLLDRDSHCGSEVSDGVVTRGCGVRVSTRTLSTSGGAGLEKYKRTSSYKTKLNISTRRSCMTTEQGFPSTYRPGRALSTELQDLLGHTAFHLLKDLGKAHHYLIIADVLLHHARRIISSEVLEAGVNPLHQRLYSSLHEAEGHPLHRQAPLPQLRCALQQLGYLEDFIDIGFLTPHCIPLRTSSRRRG